METTNYFKILLVLCSFWGAEFHTLNSDLIQSFLAEKKWSAVIFFTCWNTEDHIEEIKLLSSKGILVLMHPTNKKLSPELLKTEYGHLAIVMDLNCAGSYEILTQASEQKKFSIMHYWLLLSMPKDAFIIGDDGVLSIPRNNKRLKSNEESIITVLEPLTLPLDSHVFLAHSGSEPDYVLLQDVYRHADKKTLIITLARIWRRGQSLPPGPRRDNYGGIAIKTGVIIVSGVWEDFLDKNQRHINTMSKVSYMLMTHVAEMLNFRIDVVITDKWGFPVNETSYSGMVGVLQRGDAEIGAASLLIKAARFQFLDYAGETFPFMGAFMFLKPSLSEVSIIYTLPFSTSVWTTFVVTVIVLTIVLVYTMKLEHNLGISDSPLPWSDVVLHSLGIVCQQGFPQPPKSLSSQIIFLFLLLLSVFVLTSYSAIIVSLLQTPSSGIDTLTELMDSPFKLSIRNINYVTNYVNDTTSVVVKRLFKEKLYIQPPNVAFTTQEIGIEKIRHGLYAFHGDADTYKLISDSFQEHEKCRLKEIMMFTSNKLGFGVQKGSQLKEHITQKTRRLKEVGLINREYNQWFYQKPKCSSDSMNFVSVRLQDFYPALVVLSYGVCCALGVFILEVIYYKRRSSADVLWHGH